MQEQYSHVFFVGIGGIGMSALARYFNVQGKQVSGYDRSETALTEELVREGIAVLYADDDALISAPYKEKDHCLVIYTPAIPQDSTILNWYKKKKFDIKKRAQVLGLLTKTQQSICVGGTHGKTTISTMIGHLLYASHLGCNAFLGGISQNYKSNLLTNADSNKVVIEADEFDRSFLQLFPHTAVISSIDADHLDIYGTHEQLLDAFQEFSAQIVEKGTLIYKHSLDFNPRVNDKVKVYTYQITEGDFYVKNLNLIDGFYHFDFVTPEGIIPEFMLGVPGKVNVENAVAALSVAYLHGVSVDELREGLASFKGIRRRFQYHLRRDDLIYIDDYAHHPEELRATISSVRDIYSQKKITGIFQPHLFTRTRDFATEFAKSLSLLDEVWLMDIYPARERPIEGVSSELIMKGISCPVMLVNCEQIEEKLAHDSLQVVLTLGAGDIDRIVPVVKTALLNRIT